MKKLKLLAAFIVLVVFQGCENEEIGSLQEVSGIQEDSEMDQPNNFQLVFNCNNNLQNKTFYLYL